MSESDIAPEDEQEYEEQAERVKRDAAETKQELESKQTEALAKIKQGEDFEEYETVTLGELEMEVRAWLPGDITDTIQRAQELGESEDLSEVKESMDTMLHALDEMTTSDTYNMGFWQAYYDEYGPEGLMVAVETILEPATEGIEERKRGIESFRTER